MKKKEKVHTFKMIFRMPHALHEDFSAACLSVGIGMSEVLRQMVETFCESRGMLSKTPTKESSDAQEPPKEGPSV